MVVNEENIYKEHACLGKFEDCVIDNSRKPRYFYQEGSFSYYIGAMWLEQIIDDSDIQKIPVIVNPKIENIDFMLMFLACLKTPESAKNFNDIYKIYFDKSPIMYKDQKNLPELEPLIIAHFIYCLEPLIQKGLKHHFIYREDNISTIKGKLLFKKQIKNNILNKSKAYCRFSEYDKNCIENRILKKALTICQKRSQYSELNAKIGHCLAVFQGVSDQVVDWELNHLKINPLYKEYKPAIEVAKQIIKLQRHCEGTKKTAPPFWIDMALLFERYVYSTMLKEKEWGDIIYQRRYRSGGIPDFLLPSHHLIVDTKYKPQYITEDEIKDIRQLSAYARHEKIRNDLGIEDDNDEHVSCLIIYPEKSHTLEADKSKWSPVAQYKSFYKIGVELPTLPSDL